MKIMTILLTTLLAAVTGCAGVERAAEEGDEAQRREVQYTTGSNIPNRDRRNQNVQLADRAAMEEAARRAGASAATALGGK